MENLPEKCRIIVKEGAEYKKYIVKKNGKHVHSVNGRGTPTTCDPAGKTELKGQFTAALF